MNRCTRCIRKIIKQLMSAPNISRLSLQENWNPVCPCLKIEQGNRDGGALSFPFPFPFPKVADPSTPIFHDWVTGNNNEINNNRFPCGSHVPDVVSIR